MYTDTSTIVWLLFHSCAPLVCNARPLFWSNDGNQAVWDPTTRPTLFPEPPTSPPHRQPAALDCPPPVACAAAARAAAWPRWPRAPRPPPPPPPSRPPRPQPQTASAPREWGFGAATPPPAHAASGPSRRGRAAAHTGSWLQHPRPGRPRPEAQAKEQPLSPCPSDTTTHRSGRRAIFPLPLWPSPPQPAQSWRELPSPGSSGDERPLDARCTRPGLGATSPRPRACLAPSAAACRRWGGCGLGEGGGAVGLCGTRRIFVGVHVSRSRAMSSTQQMITVTYVACTCISVVELLKW